MTAPVIMQVHDLGSTSSRIMVNVGREFNPQVMIMEPEIIRTTLDSATSFHTTLIGKFNSAYSGWVELKGGCYCYGDAAKNLKAELQLGKSKFELAIPKILATTGAISEGLNLPNGTTINLGVLLPYREYGDKDIFEHFLRSYLQNFKFCGNHKSFNLNHFVCLPEISGVMLQAKVGKKTSNSNQIGLMLGFRDVSAVYVSKGSLSGGTSKDLGFHELCEFVGQKIAFHDYKQLAQAISKAESKIYTKELQPLLGNLNKTYRQAKLTQIKQAIKEGRKNYLFAFDEWFKANIRGEVDEVIIAGGTAHYFRQELDAMLKKTSVSRINWCDDLEERIRSSFASVIEQHSPHYRLSDVYGLFFYLWEHLSQNGDV